MGGSQKGGDFPPRNLLLNLPTCSLGNGLPPPSPLRGSTPQVEAGGRAGIRKSAFTSQPPFGGYTHSAEPQQGENLPGSPSTRRPLPNSKQVTRPPHPQGAIQGPPPITEPSPRLSPTQSSKPLLGRGPQGPGPSKHALAPARRWADTQSRAPSH